MNNSHRRKQLRVRSRSGRRVRPLGKSVVLSSPSADIITTYGSAASSDAMGTTLAGGTISLAAAARSIFGGARGDGRFEPIWRRCARPAGSQHLHRHDDGHQLDPAGGQHIPGRQNNGGVLGNGTVGNVTSVSGTISPATIPSPGRPDRRQPQPRWQLGVPGRARRDLARQWDHGIRPVGRRRGRQSRRSRAPRLDRHRLYPGPGRPVDDHPEQ